MSFRCYQLREISSFQKGVWYRLINLYYFIFNFFHFWRIPARLVEEIPSEEPVQGLMPAILMLLFLLFKNYKTTQTLLWFDLRNKHTCDLSRTTKSPEIWAAFRTWRNKSTVQTRKSEYYFQCSSGKLSIQILVDSMLLFHFPFHPSILPTFFPLLLTTIKQSVPP